MTSTENAAFIIGGYAYKTIDIIAKFQDNEWARYESLKAARVLPGSITNADQTMIIGGYAFS